MVFQLSSFSVQLSPNRLLATIGTGLRNSFDELDFLKKFVRPNRFTKSKKLAARQAEHDFIQFIVNTATNSTFGEDLRWQIESFKRKSKTQRAHLFPGFYLYVERYLFNSVETSKQAFREVLYQQYQVAIDQNHALKVIFLNPENQKTEIFRRFLYSVARRSQRYIRSSNGIAFGLQYWLEGKNSFTSFSKITKKTGTDLYIQITHDYFSSLCKQLGDKQALKIFNESYDRQALRYQNLDSFQELLRLFPSQALDETKYNLLSTQQMRNLLAEKVTKLETVTAELNEKNRLLEQSYDEVLTQSEQLNSQNHQLAEAQTLIHMMNDELSSYSSNLEEKIQERTKELAHSNEMLIHYNNNLEQYTHTISHQLKAPIARILGLTNLLKVVPSNEKPVIANSVHHSAKELETVFKDLVHALNFKKEVAELKPEKVHLKDLLVTSWNEAVKNHPSAPIVEWNVSDQTTMETDRKHLTNALAFIFDNALKFHQPESTPHIMAQVNCAHDRVEIQIQDQGIGFDSDEVKAKLFTPFQRFNLTHTGRGLGLYLTKQHVTVLGGDVHINSVVNKGTQVKIDLPAKLVKA